MFRPELAIPKVLKIVFFLKKIAVILGIHVPSSLCFPFAYSSLFSCLVVTCELVQRSLETALRRIEN
jgi:hypothetical protein